MTKTTTTLLLVRHGETDANASGTWQGSTDSPLNQRGRAQAEALARRLASENHAIAAVYSSPLSRAQQTAEIIASQIGSPVVNLEADLQEFNLGDWEGLTYDELRFEKRLWDRMRDDPTFTPPGGESAWDFGTRLLYSIRKIASDHPGETVIVVSHGGAIATALALIVSGDGQKWPDYQMLNCALSELVFDPDPSLKRLNVREHLQGVGALTEWQ